MSLPAFSVRNHVLVNMLMVVILVAGTAFAFTLVREMFPESRPNKIGVMALYPATLPQELEKAVTIKVEEAVRDVEGVEKVDSNVNEGMSTTTLTLYNDVDDVDVVLQEVKNEIDALQDLPDDLEQITIFKIEPTLPVIMVAVYGDGSEAALKRATRAIRDDILQLPGVSDVQLAGVRDDEISVEVRPDRLLEYDVTFEEVAAAIRQTNVDVSAGNLKGDRSQVAVRTLGEELTAEELEDIEIRSLPGGQTVRLRDVAYLRDGFVESDVKSYFNSRPAMNLIVQKTPSQDAIQISNLIKAYIAGKRQADFDPYGFAAADEKEWYVRPFSKLASLVSMITVKISGRPDPMQYYERSLNAPFEHNFEVALHTDLARFVEGRLELLTRNGRAGLILVLICLNLFLNWRVAFWTAVGLPVSFLGTFVLMWAFGATINLLSMFGLIIVLGIIVDDAIVIGENIFRHLEEGMPAQEAAIKGAEEVLWPVTIAVSTTIAAFMPLLFISGQIGDFMQVLPIVVIAALSVSLLEAIVILPAHLSHLPPMHKRNKSEENVVSRTWHTVGAAKQNFMDALANSYERFLRFALRWRYATIAVSLSTCIVAMGLFVGKTANGYTLGNIVPWEFVQKMDAESMVAVVEMPIGSNAEAVRERLQVLSDAALELPEVATVQMDVAQAMSVGEGGAMSTAFQSHLGQLWVELEEADKRDRAGLRSSDEVLAELRKVAESLSGVNSVTWEVMNGGPGGKDIEIRVSGNDFGEIRAAADDLKTELAAYAGVVDLDDNQDRGKREVQITLRDSARPTGITVAQLGQFVRHATYGAEARRLTRNREDVKIMVRYPEETREDVYNLEAMYIPTGPPGPNREWVPMSEVAELNETIGFTTIYRSQQQRSITVSGEVDAAVVKPGDVLTQFRASYLPELQQRYPNVRVEFLGSAEEQAKAFASLQLATPVALLLIYMLLAGLFRSYFQPLVVMAAIPFGIQGAIVGHWVTGYPMTILSAIGMVALTGIIVNDSLVLVDFINSRIRRGMSQFEASVIGAKLRLRPILLTTLTTAAGLTPLMFETSFQAKFLIPMAVTLTFGLIFATALTLVIVPALNLIFFDVRIAARRVLGTAVRRSVYDPSPVVS